MKKLILFMFLTCSFSFGQIVTDPCVALFGAGFRVWGPTRVAAGAVVAHMCVDANGNLLPVKIMLFQNGIAGAYTPAGAGGTAVNFTAPSNSGTIACRAASTVQNITLTFTPAAVVAFGVLPQLAVVDESNTAAAGNKVIKNPGGTTLATITTNGGSWQGYCTAATCFTTSLR